MHHITDKDFRCRARPAGRRGDTRRGPGVRRRVLILSRCHPSLSLAYVTHFIFSARPGKTQPACDGLCYDTHVKCSLLYQTHYMLNAVRHGSFS